MNTNHGLRSNVLNNEFIIPPAYPFRGGELLQDLRSRIEKIHQCPISLEELARMMGQPRTSVWSWFSVYHHPHLTAFMALLERLSGAQRQSFIESFCREFPIVSHPRLVGTVGKLDSLLNQSVGLTVITGSTDRARTFVLTALGHSWTLRHGMQRRPDGIDIHEPITFVPVGGVHYIDQRLKPDRIRYF